MTYTPDGVLLERWQKKQDADAFALLVERYSGMVYSCCRRMLQNSSEAKDITQECFIALMQTGDNLRLSLGAWLHTIAVRRCIDHIRKSSRRRHREHGYAQTISAEIMPSDMVIKEVLVKVDEAIETLPAPLREAIVARFLEGQQHTEAARSLGIAESTVRHRVNQAVEQVREHLKKEGVTVGIAAIVAALEQSVEALPAAVIVGIGKLAVSGAVKSGIVIGGAAVAKLSVVLAILIAVLGLGKGIPFLEKSPPNTAKEVSVAEIPDNHNAPQETPMESFSEGKGVASETSTNETSAAMVEDKEKEEEPFSIKGRIYDAETGKGIAGVVASVYPAGGGVYAGESVPTGTDGIYQIGTLADGTYSILLNEVPGYSTSYGRNSLAVTITGGTPVSGADFSLKKGIPISGIVKSIEGYGVPNVKVGVVTSTNPNPVGAESNDDGSFIIYIPNPDSQVMVQAQDKEYESNLLRNLTVPDSGLEGLTLVLEQPRTGIISGVVVDGDGNPVKGLHVLPGRQQPAVFTYDSDDETDSAGHFWVEGLAPGKYAIIVTPSDAGFSNSEEYARVELEAGEKVENLHIVFGELGGYAVAGTVVNVQGDPVQDASISHYGEQLIRVYSDRDGSFTMTGLSKDGASLQVEHRDYSRNNVHVEAGTFDAVIVLQDRSQLHGRVVNAVTGEPLTKFTFGYLCGAARKLDEMLFNSGHSVESNEGTFNADNLHTGEVTVIAWAAGFSPSWEILPVEAGKNVEIELRLEPSDPVEGIVVDEHGNAITGAMVYFTSGTALDRIDRAAATRSDSNGYFILDSPPKKLEWLGAYKAGYGVGIAYPSDKWRIVLPEEAVVEGVVHDDNNPSGEFMINVYYESGELPSLQLRLGSDGRFRIPGLSPGLVTVSTYPNQGGSRRTIKYNLLLQPGTVEQLEMRFEYGRSTVEGNYIEEDVQGKLISLYLECQREGYMEVLQTRPDQNGWYRFENVNEGTCALKASYVTGSDGNPETVVYEFPLVLIDGETLRYDITITP